MISLFGGGRRIDKNKKLKEEVKKINKDVKKLLKELKDPTAVLWNPKKFKEVKNLIEKILNEIRDYIRSPKNLHDPNLTKIQQEISRLGNSIGDLYRILNKYQVQSRGAGSLREEGAAIKDIARIEHEIHGLLNAINKL
jgi:gas vesicle protein